MALQVKYEHPTSKQVYPEAYLRIQKIQTAHLDYEFFAKSDKEGVEEELRWITRLENIVTVFVWSDDVARDNRAIVVHWFTFEFDYELSSPENIYTQAYKWLNDKKFDGSALDV